jgi:putative transmembrane protein PGPGW
MSEQPGAAPGGSHRRLPLGLRILVFAAGWMLILIGVAGLVLPGIQGVLTLLAGVALLSLVSELAYRSLRRALRRWPAAWQRVERFRERAHDWLHRLGRKED